MPARVGLIGHPVAHSISPRFQQAAFDAIGFDARYEAWDLAPDDLEAFVEGFRQEGSLGANVTIPYKEVTARSMDRLHQTARFVGAINTIVRSENATLEGYNTDVSGFQRTLEAEGFDPDGKQAVIWGAGGAARAVAWGLIWRQIGGLTICNRTAVRAGRLRHDLSSAAIDVTLRAHGIDDAEAAAALAGADLVVNCTPVGLRGAASEEDVPFDVALLPAHATVVDLIANPVETPLVRTAKQRGLPAVGGLPMLVYQGAASFELWTRREAPIGIMFEAAEAAMTS